MITTARVAEVRKHLEAARTEGRRVGFVPTMGALHDGHRSLVRRARSECGFVVVSVFVNPTQFGPGEDFERYPRTLESDLAMCLAEGVDLVFHPGPDEMYPRPPLTRVTVEGLTSRMEGSARPGHFEGVALVCAKLFNIVGPCTAYFGAKDAQQLRVIRRMVADLDFPVDVVECPTVREPDGLALSSRNRYLAPDERPRALLLVQALQRVRDLAGRGERDARALERAGREVLAGVDAVDYFEVVHPATLEPLERVEGAALVCGAVRIGRTRLIDNMMLASEECR